MIRRSKSPNEITKEQEHIFKCVKALSDLSEKLEHVPKEAVTNIVESQFGYSQDKICDIEKKEQKTDLEKMLLNYIYTLPESDKQAITKFNYKRPATVTIPTPKPVEEMFDGKDLSIKQNIVVSSPKSPERFVVPTQVVVIADAEDAAVNLNRKLTPFDRSVFNGICSIYKAGNEVFTLKQVYHAMGGKETVKQETLDKIRYSVMKLRATFVSVDWSEHLRMSGLQISEKITMKTDSAMISVEGIQLKLNGQQVYGYKFLSELPLLKYADTVNQICTINREMLEVSLKRTDENIVLIQYLARWLSYNRSKNPGKKVPVSYSFIFTKIGLDIETTERHKRKRIIDAIKKILAEWLDKKYINAFSEYVANKTFGGIIVEIPEEKTEDEMNELIEE